MYERGPQSDPTIKIFDDEPPKKPPGSGGGLLIVLALIVILGAGGGIYRTLALKNGWPWIQEPWASAQQETPTSGNKAGAGIESSIDAVAPQADPALPNVQTNLNVTGRPFVNRVPKDVCPDGIKTRIFWRDDQLAFLTRENCKDVSAKTISPSSFEHVSTDKTIVVIKQKLYDAEELTDRVTMVYCHGSGKSDQPLETSIRRFNATGDLLAQLTYVMPSKSETVEVPVSFAKAARMDSYSTAAARKDSPPKPFYQLNLANANGWTGFLTYSLEFMPGGQGPSAWRNDQLTVPNCYLP